MTERADLLLTGGYVLTMDDQNRIYDPGAVAIANGRVVAVGPEAEVAPRFQAAQTLNVRHHAVMPGLLDIYSHAGHGLIKALYHPRLGWPTNRVYFHASTPEWWEAEAELTALERLRFGVTFGHTVLGATPARADDAVYADAHMRGVLRVGIREMVSVGPPDPFVPHVPEPWSATDWRSGSPVEKRFTYEQCLDVAAELVRRWHGTHEGRMRVSLHPPYLFGRHAKHSRFRYDYKPEDTKVVIDRAVEMRALADQLGVSIITHVFRDSIAWGYEHMGKSMFGVLKPDVLLAHSNGLSAHEVELVGQSGAAVVWAPSTGENAWYGLCPVPALLARGVRVAICTDGNAPRFSMDLWKDMYRAILTQAIEKHDMGALAAGRVLRMVTIEAARALGVGREVGSLEAGKLADVITVDLRAPHLTPRIAIPNLLAFYVQGHDVSSVIVGGRLLMHDRKVLTVSPDAVIERGQAEAEAAFRRHPVDEFMKWDDVYWNAAMWPE